MKRRGLIIGFDGAPYRLIKKWIDKGELPFLAYLSKQGVFGILESIIPPYTMIAWPVFYTGKNPAKIGPFLLKGKGFDPESFSKSEFINSTDIKTWTLWELLSKYDFRVGVVNVPMTYPPKPVNGFIITDFTTPKRAKDWTYPENLKEKLKGYKTTVFLDEEMMGHPDRKVNKEKIARELHSILEQRIEYSKNLIVEFSPDFFITNFKETDDFMHFFFDDEERVLQFFKKADNYANELYNLMEPDVCAIISDHGFHISPTIYFHINTFLEKEGYLKRAKSLRGKLSIFLYNFGVKTVKIFPLIRNLIPDRIKMKIARGEMKTRIDWENSKCYANWYAGIYFNPSFFKDENEKREFAFLLKEKLLQIENPLKKERVFKKVQTRYEIFSGPYFDTMPELVFTTTENYKLNTNLVPELFDKRIDRPDLTGHHLSDLEGIFIIKGNSICKGKREIKLQLKDIFPIFLYLLGCPIPDDTDGKIKDEIFEDPETLKKNPPEFISLYYEPVESKELQEEEIESVKKHLKGLGYL